MTSKEAIHVREFGNPCGPTMILFHGVLDAGSNWPDLVAHWGDKWRILAADHRSHGLSPRFTEAELQDVTSVWVDDVLDLVRAQEAPPVVLGHSLGAYLSLTASLLDPAAFGAIVLEDPPLPAAKSRPQGVMGNLFENYVNSFNGQGYEQVVKARAERPWTEREIVAWVESKAFVDRAMLRALNLPARDWSQPLAATTVPTLFTLPKDKTLGDPAARKVELEDVVACNNPKVKVEWMAEVGHEMRRDDPAVFYGIVEEFLTEFGLNA
ncbi:MAG: alpha/beta hydrolase [Promicromonosporaceae bacterium]|nr:alpha/beta hydrolase [Promicromonosporaceae bacterium]